MTTQIPANDKRKTKVLFSDARCRTQKKTCYVCETCPTLCKSANGGVNSAFARRSADRQLDRGRENILTGEQSSVADEIVFSRLKREYRRGPLKKNSVFFASQDIHDNYKSCCRFNSNQRFQYTWSHE